MTVSDPGAGQQQGREAIDWRGLLDAELERMGKLLGAASVAIWPHGQAQITINEAAYAPVHNAMGALGNIRTLIRRLHDVPSPIPPARDSGRDKARDVEAPRTEGRVFPCTVTDELAPPGSDASVPARDEAREAARDAIGQLLSEWTASQRWWIKASEADRESYREDADAVLDLPAVRRLLDGAR